MDQTPIGGFLAIDRLIRKRPYYTLNVDLILWLADSFHRIVYNMMRELARDMAEPDLLMQDY